MAAPVRPKALAPIVVDSTNDKFDFNRGGAKVATLTQATYATVIDLLDHLVAQMTTADGTRTYTYSIATAVGSEGVVTLTIDSSTYTILFNTGANASKTAAVGDQLGFTTAADTSAAASQTGTYQHADGWYSNVPIEEDPYDRPARKATQTVTLGGQNKLLTYGSVLGQRQVIVGFLAAERCLIARESASDLNRALERMWQDHPDRFRWFDDHTATLSSDGVDYFLQPGDTLAKFNAERMFKDLEVYRVTWPMQRYY